MLKKKWIMLLMVLTLFVVGCTTAPQPELTTMQLREMTIKEMEGTYKNVFKSVMTVLQDNDFIIETTDFNSGLIVGRKDVDPKLNSSDIMMILFVDIRHSRNKKVVVSAVVSEVGENLSRVRLNIQEKTIQKGTWGPGKELNINVQNKEIYTAIFNQIRTELSRINVSE